MTELQSRTQLASERVIINSPMSFAGAAQRSYRIGKNQTGTELWVIRVLLSTPLVLIWWGIVIVWYAITIGLLGLLTIPYRLLRRGARKRKAEALRHREALAAIGRAGTHE